MNTTFSRLCTTSACIAALAVGSATTRAQEATPDHPQASTSTLTRAEVMADLARAKRDGSLAVYSGLYNPLAAARSLKTRAEVRAELLAAGRDDVAALHGEDSGSFALSRAATSRSRSLLASR